MRSVTQETTYKVNSIGFVKYKNPSGQKVFDLSFCNKYVAKFIQNGLFEQD